MINARQKRKVKVLSIATLPVLGIIFLVWAIASPIGDTVPTAPLKKSSFMDTQIALPPSLPIASFHRPLQQPLNPPEQKPEADKKKKLPVVSWPKFNVECIFWAERGALTVVNYGQKRHQCFVGDQVGNVTIEQIEKQAVVASFRGQSKTFQIASQP